MESRIVFNLFPPKRVREHKGASLLEFPSDFTVVDIETTGLSPVYDSIIEIAAIKYTNGSVSDTFSSLLKPKNFCPNFIDSFIEELTGISNDMIGNAPDCEKVLKDFSSFVGNSIIVAHNAHFDINFLYDDLDNYCNFIFSNNFIDTMRISKLLHKEMEHHRLSDLAAHYGVSYDGAHRALTDCYITLDIFLKMREEFYTTHESGAKLTSLYKHRVAKSSDIVSETDSFDDTHPLYGKVCVFTGSLEKMTRKEAMQCVANVGGINGDSVNKNTNYLILGNNAYHSNIKDGKSNKQKKAEQLLLAGYDISIIDENVFYDMFSE